MRIVHVIINEDFKKLYSSIQDRDTYGIVFQEDNDYMWIRPFSRTYKQESYIGSPVRYNKSKIQIIELG
jgi:hypothetical protein